MFMFMFMFMFMSMSIFMLHVACFPSYDDDDAVSKHLTPRPSVHDDLPARTLHRSCPERALTHFITNVVSILLIILDAALYTYRTIAKKEGVYVQIAFVLLAIFCFEVLSR